MKKMNRIILVGNGYDSHLGLKVDYPNLLSKALYNISKESNLKDEILMKVDEDVKANIESPDKNGIDVFFNELLKLKKNNKIEIKSKLLEELLSELKNTKYERCNYENIKYYVCSFNDYENKCSEIVEQYIANELKLENNQKSVIKDYNEKINGIVNILKLDEEKENINKTLICNFNYTDTFEDVARQIRHEGDILYLHGTLKNNDYEFGTHYDTVQWKGANTPTHYDSKGWEKEPYDFLTRDILKMHLGNKKRNTPEFEKLKNFISSDGFELFTIGSSFGDSDGLLFYNYFLSKNCCLVKPMIYANNYQEIKKKIKEGMGEDFDINKIAKKDDCFAFPN